MAYPDGSSYTNMTAFAAALKELYGPQKVKNMVYKNNPFLALLKKEEDWSGKVIPFPIITGNPQGRSHTFATAQANVTASKVYQFVLQLQQDYAIATITNLVALSTRNDDGAFLKAIKTEIDGAMNNIKNSLAADLFRSGTGTKGSQTVAISSGVITLADPQTVTAFELGQTLEASTTDGGAAIGSPDYGYVVAVDRSTGKVTVSTSQGGAAGAPASWSASTLYFRVAGDRNLAITGLGGWLPTGTVSPSDSFFGVNRSVDRTRLAGVAYDGSSQSIEEALIDAAALVAREDSSPEVCVTNFATWSALVKALGSKVQYVNATDTKVGVAFRGLRLVGPSSEINVFADRSCPQKTAYLLDMDSWVLGSAKSVPHILTELDGMTMLRSASSDATECRVGYYATLACNAPGHNAVITLQN